MKVNRMQIAISAAGATLVLGMSGVIAGCSSSANAAPSQPPPPVQVQYWSGWTNTIPAAPGYVSGAYTGNFCYRGQFMLAVESSTRTVTVTATGQSC